MKTHMFWIVAAAVLMFAAGAGSGIARAEATHDEAPVLSFEDQETLDRCGSRAATGEDRPVLSFEDQETLRVAMAERKDNDCGSR